MILDAKQLKPGNILAQDVVMPSGRTLMTTGMILTQSMIDLIVKRNFETIDIDEKSIKSDSNAHKVFTDDILVNDTMLAFKDYVNSRSDYYELIEGKP